MDKFELTNCATLQESRSGLTLVEILIASVLAVVVIFSLIKGTKGLLDVSLSTKRQNDAASLVQEIATTLKTIPYDDVYALSTDDKTPPPFNLATVNWEKYRIRWEVSPSSPVFYALESKVKEKGFEGYELVVRYLFRRRATLQGWNFNTELSTRFQDGFPRDCFDDRDRDIGFVDFDGDGEFYDGSMETPQTGMKDVDIFIYKKDGQVAAKQRTLITKTKLASEEMPSGGSPLSVVFDHRHDIILFRASALTLPHLNYKSVRGLDQREYTSGHLRRCDQYAADVVFDSDQFGQFTVPANDGHKHWGLNVVTEPTGELEVCVMDPNLFQPVIPCVTLQCDRSKIVGNRDDYLVFTRDNSAWQSIYTYGATTLGVVNPNNFFFIFHARKKVGTQTSPWSEFVPLVDEAFPLALTPLPQDDPFPAGYGNRPLERISVRDDETRWYDQQGINAALSALIVSDGVTSTTTWYYKGGEYDLKINDEAREPYGGYHSTHTYTLLNQELLPPAFQTNVPLDFLFEFGDRASFKNTHAWTNTLPGYVGDGSGPNIVIGSVLGAWATGISRVKTGPLTPIAKDQTFDLRAVTLRDDESGIDWETVRIEECPGDGAGGVVGSCVDVLRYNPAVRPGGKKFGQYFEFWLPSEPDPAKRQTRLTSLATHAFHTPGFRILRISAENCNHIGGQTLWEFNVS